MLSNSLDTVVFIEAKEKNTAWWQGGIVIKNLKINISDYLTESLTDSDYWW